MSKIINLSIQIIIILILGFRSVIAQEKLEPDMYPIWINAGLGISSLGAIGGNAGLSVQSGKWLYTIRGTANSENSGILSGGDEFFDVALLFGIATENKKNHASFSIGIARVTGSRYREGSGGFLFSGKRNDISPTIGLPMESQLFFKISGFLGLGLNLYFNLNKEESFGGLSLNLMLGSLR